MRVVVVDVSDQIRALNKTTTSLRRTNSFTRAMATLQEAAEPVVKTPPRSASDASLLTRGSLIRVGGKWVRESASPASSSTSPATSLTTLSFAATSNAAAARSLLTAVVNALEHTGGTICAAGVIMALAFGALLVGHTPALNQIGFLLVLGVLVDCFVTTKLIIPCCMALIPDRANLWPRRAHAHAAHGKPRASGADGEAAVVASVDSDPW